MERLLRFEQVSHQGLSFLAVQHDVWSNAAGNSVIGFSARFIDSQWKLRMFTLGICLCNETHAAADVARIMNKCALDTYSVSLSEMTKFVMSDTTASARNVANFFSDVVQDDCAMHLLNLCLLYGLGLKENTRSGQIVTPGGAFGEGKQLINLLRSMAKHFNHSASRLHKLKEVQISNNLPCGKPRVDPSTRVSYANRLIRDCILHHDSLNMYRILYERHEAMYQFPTEYEWVILCEIEAVTRAVSKMSLNFYQRDCADSAFIMLHRALIWKNLNRESFECYEITKPDKTNFAMQDIRTKQVEAEDLTPEAQTCLNRLKEQVLLRFDDVLPENCLPLLLDPRTISCARQVIVQCLFERHNAIHIGNDIYNETVELFKTKHQQYYSKIRALHELTDVSNVPTDTTTTSDQSDTDDGFTMFANQPLRPIDAHDRVQIESNEIVNNWLDQKINWDEVALKQKKLRRNTPEATSVISHLSVKRSGEYFYDPMGLYRNINILEWFRDQGSALDEAIRGLARIYLSRAQSSAMQERVFSIGNYVMSPLRTSTTPDRSSKQLVLKSNNNEVQNFRQQVE